MQDNDASLRRILLQAPQVGAPRSRALQSFRENHIQQTNREWFNGVYQAGPGSALSGLNNQAQMSSKEVGRQDRAMKPLASNTATWDFFLKKAAQGFKLINLITISRGRSYWTSHTPLLIGGHLHLPFRTIQLFNQEGLGDLLKPETLAGPTIDSHGYKRREPGSQLPLVPHTPSTKATE